MSQKIAAVTKLIPKPGQFAALCACAEQMVAATRDEAGTEVYLVACSSREPEALLVVELFSDKAALREHLSAGGPIGDLLAPHLASVEAVLAAPLASKGLAI